MRKLVYTAFIAFWAAIATIAVIARLSERQPTEPEPARQVFTLDEVARHDAPDDCWMAIEGRVYDLSDYLPRHPAPREIIVEWCGREASEGMRTKGKNSRHSERAWRLLERYRIGDRAD